MLIPAFQLNLGNSILQGLACVGKYDGTHPSLTCATSAGKVFMHSPHEHDSSTTTGSVRFLNINRRITALAAGAMGGGGPKATHELLFVGTQTNLLAYDVEANSDLFYKDVPDGVSSLIVGMLPTVDRPLAIVGGNCSIQGFDRAGEEMFWTVAGSTVTALAFCDVDGDGRHEMLVGSDDSDIRILAGEDVIAETSEMDAVTGLTPIALTKFGFSLANGTTGVYNNTTRVWRKRSKYTPTALHAFDLDADGVPELVSGWSSGRVDVRSDKDGDLIYRDTLNGPVSAIVKADYRLDGREEVICCGADGEIRGYLPAEAGASLMPTSRDQNAVKELMERKQEYMQQLRALEANLKIAKSGDTTAAIIPTSTRISVTAEMSTAQNCVEIVIATNNDTVIRCALVFAVETDLFEGESLMLYPSTPGQNIRIPLRSPKNVALELRIQVLVAARAVSTNFHVFEITHKLPKFAMFKHVTERGAIRAPQSSVTFYVAERTNRVLLWLQQNFQMESIRAQETLEAEFVCLRDGSPLVIRMTPENGGKIMILCDDMDTAAEIIQDLCADLGVNELESVADFPKEMAAFRDVLMKVDEFNAIRLKLTAEMADSSNAIKTLVIQAEDARILGDMKQMKRMYSELYALNNELIGEYTKRSNNHQELLNALKDVNHMIQKAAKLRVGGAKARVINLCRAAIKTNSIQSLFQIISQGKSAGTN